MAIEINSFAAARSCAEPPCSSVLPLDYAKTDNSEPIDFIQVQAQRFNAVSRPQELAPPQGPLIQWSGF